MLKKRENQKRRLGNKGFTLVELLIVIAILLVISGIAAPALLNNVKKARETADKATATQIANAMILAVAETEGTIPPISKEKFEKVSSTTTSSQDLVNKAFDNVQGSFKAQSISGGSFYVSVETGTGKVSVYIGTSQANATTKVYPVE